MGSGSRAYREALGEALAIQEHQLAMIPIMKGQAEMEIGMKELAFEQELEQVRKLNLLAQEIQQEQVLALPEVTTEPPVIVAPEMMAKPSAPPPILVAAEVTAKPPGSEYLIYAGLAGLAYFFFR